LETGLILSVIASLMFSTGIIIIRKASARTGESFSVAAVSVLIGVPFFAVAVTMTGDWDKILTASWSPLVMLMSAGVIHFIFGRLLGYSAYRLIGANKATPFIMTDRFYTLLFCFLFLGEPFTVFIIGGVLCMFFGAALITTEKKTVAEKKEKGHISAEVKGILLALLTAFLWGTTPVLIKPGVEAIGSPVAGAFVSYGAAAVVMLCLLLSRSRRQQVTQLPLVKSLTPMALAGVCTATGQLLYYTALRMSPANIVTPLLGTQVIFIFILSFLVNRRIEVFSWKVALGMVATLAGTYLLFH
jgi:drug/metabolite transporter (DMT)-like permease